MKTGAALWPTSRPSKGVVQLLTVVSGNTAALDIGKLMLASVEKADANGLRIMLNGEALIVRGLPASMLGKKINIMAHRSGSRLELAWFVATAAANSSTPVQQNSPHAHGRDSAEIESGKENGARATSQADASGKPPEMPLKAGAGEIIALVHKRLGNGNIRFNIAGKSFESPAPPSVKQGDALILRAAKSGETEVLRIERNIGHKALGLLRRNLPAATAPASAIASIHELLASLPANEWPDVAGLPQLLAWLEAAGSSSDAPVNGRQLAGLMRDSGQNLESKLMAALQQQTPELPVQKDLKAILLQIASLNSGQLQPDNLRHKAMARLLAELAGQGAARIEAGQAFNVLAGIHHEPLRFEFPMLVNQQVINVQLAVEQNSRAEQHRQGEDQADGQNYNVLFTLELSRLGRLRIDANISQNTVFARIYHDHAGSQQFIQQHIPRLESRLHDLGYGKVFLTASTAPPDAGKQARFDDLTCLRPAASGLLDIRV